MLPIKSEYSDFELLLTENVGRRYHIKIKFMAANACEYNSLEILLDENVFTLVPEEKSNFIFD